MFNNFHIEKYREGMCENLSQIKSQMTKELCMSVTFTVTPKFITRNIKLYQIPVLHINRFYLNEHKLRSRS